MRDLVVLFIHFIATLVAGGELASPLPVTLLAQIVAGAGTTPVGCVAQGVAHFSPKTIFYPPHNVLMQPRSFNNLRGAELFRNRQVSGSSPLVGSILFRSLRSSPPLPTVQLLYH
jgi:hypothetical protein